MSADAPILYFDLGSPYAYLALERAKSVLGRTPELEPVLVGAIFRWRGWGSWSSTPERSARAADIEERARRHGLAPIVWPSGWPADGLLAMRAATWAKQQQRIEPFAQAVFRCQFVEGADIADADVIADCAARAALDPRAMMTAVTTPEVKETLRQSTERAWAAGVRGVPSLKAAGTIFYGDDKLEEAAAHLGSAVPD